MLYGNKTPHTRTEVRRLTSDNSLHRFLHKRLQQMLGPCAYAAVEDLAALEQYEGGDGGDGIARGETGFFVHVDFEDGQFARVFLRQGFHHGHKHAAGAAPGRPEVRQYGQFAVDDSVKVFCCSDLDAHILFPPIV